MQITTVGVCGSFMINKKATKAKAENISEVFISQK